LNLSRPAGKRLAFTLLLTAKTLPVDGFSGGINTQFFIEVELIPNCRSE
jgi:hypothetical protein